VINLITDQKVWTSNQLRKRVEKYNLQQQKPGDETLLARVNDAILLGLLPDDYDLTGFNEYRNGQYLPRALEAGEIGRAAALINQHLAKLIKIQQSLVTYRTTFAQIEGEFALVETIKDELDNDIDNPALVAAKTQNAAALSVASNVSFEDWKLLAQRQSGVVIEDDTELLLAIIGIIPTLDILDTIIESNTGFKVNKRMTFANSKEDLITQVKPPDPESELI
jgi:hypothetical protein